MYNLLGSKKIAMKISTVKKLIAKKSSSTTKKRPTKTLAEVKDVRDLENSLTDWNAEHNQSGRHK